MDLPPPLRPGDPAPLFRARASNGAQSYDFGSVAGRYLVLAFLGSAAQEPGQQAMAAVRAQRRLFDDRQASFFGLSADPADETEGRLTESLPEIRFFWDHDLAISRRYGALGDAPAGTRPVYRGFWLVLDPMLRVLAAAPLAEAERVLDQPPLRPRRAARAGSTGRRVAGRGLTRSLHDARLRPHQAGAWGPKTPRHPAASQDDQHPANRRRGAAHVMRRSALG